MDIIEILLSLRGNALTFFADTSALGDDQVEVFAKSIKPYNFFNMDTMKQEPVPGMKTNVIMDPLTGRPVSQAAAPGKPQPEGPDQPGPKDGAIPGSGKEAKPVGKGDGQAGPSQN